MGRIPTVVIGGGTGASIVVAGLKKYPLELSVIVPTSDSGGSSGRLCRELGIIPVGDIRQCVLALSNFSTEQRDLWNYRFPSGSLAGHALGNLILAAVLQSCSSVDLAMEWMRSRWQLAGCILPMTATATTLCARYRDGTVVRGEHEIDEPKKLHGGIERVVLKKKERLNPQAARALARARLIVIAPGDLYTSIIPPMLARGFASALSRSKARIVQVANLMTKRGQTDGFALSQLVGEVDRYLGVRRVDTVLANSAVLPKTLLARYSRLGERPITADLAAAQLNTKRVVRASLVDARAVQARRPADRLRRSMLRHDPDKLARVIMKILKFSERYAQ